jgi:tetratricopeptide (TPR) repeat protein
MATNRQDKWLLPTGLAALALVVGTVALLRDVGPDAPLAPVFTAPAQSVSEETLRREIESLKQRLVVLESSTGRQEVFDQARIDEMVAKAVAGRSGPDGAPAVDSASASSQGAMAAAIAAGLVEELAQVPFGPQRDELWKKLQEAGGVDAAVAYFERAAASQPGSADAQTNLGAAYIQKMLQTQDEHQRIELGKKIEGQFDQALALQPDHWEARFRKAVGLTYGPALSGRQSEAIGHFEKLVAQQAGQPASAQFAQTYLYLGRLYAQRGDAERAQQVWQQGLLRHPQDPELRQFSPH